MKPKYLINEKRAFTIFIVLVAIPIVNIIYQNINSEKRESEKINHLLQINNQLDSLKSIQIDIADYDMTNHTDSIFDNCNCLPSLSMDADQSENTLNLDNLTKDLEYQSLEELQKREKMLVKNLYSIQQSIDIAKQKMIVYATIFDSISPLFTLSQRDNIQQRINTLDTKVIITLEKSIAQLKTENQTTHFFIYYIRFLFVIILLLFPVRWVLIYFHNTKQTSFQPQVPKHKSHTKNGL